MKKCALLLLLILFTSMTAVPQSPNASQTLLKKVQDEYWQHQLKESLYLRMKYGLTIGRLPDLSFKKAKEEVVFAKSILEQLKEVKPEELVPDEKLSLQILEWENKQNLDSLPYFYLTSPITPYSSPIPLVQRVFTEFQFKEETDLDRYYSLLKLLPDFITSAQTHVAEQWRLGIVLPKEEIQLVHPFLQSMIQEPEKSVFYVKAERIAGLGEKAGGFQKQIAELIKKEVNPALKKLAEFVDGEYKSKAPDHVGLSQFPLGKDYYRFLVRYHTSMNVTPEEVHQIGLEEMAKINEGMEKIRAELKFPGTKAEFHVMLKTDPKFFPKTPEEIEERLMSLIRRIEPKIGDFFLQIPKAPYGVKRLDPLLEGSMTFGYYQTPTPQEPKGLYMYNGSNLNQRSLLWAGSLIYHELVPGHHFQINLQSENGSLPEFRRENMPTAYVEGWAEYASELAGEMRMYQDPYERYGRLAMKAFLTTRLVVDTGMNALGWPRSKAIDYMRENLLISDTEINTETLRYSCDIQGQALAYMMGANKILELRERVRQQKKDGFDIRKFHEAVLAIVAMPMLILEEHVLGKQGVQ